MQQIFLLVLFVFMYVCMYACTKLVAWWMSKSHNPIESPKFIMGCHIDLASWANKKAPRTP